jgi:hypothetical protein
MNTMKIQLQPQQIQLFWKEIRVYSKNCTKHLNALYGENAVL